MSKKGLYFYATLMGAMLLAVAVPVIGQGNKSLTESSSVEHIPIGDQAVVTGAADTFTGRVTIRGQFQRSQPARVAGAVVRFEPGARTAWHSHPLGQTLIVTEGSGWTAAVDSPKLAFAKGDIIWCPPDVKHWHGATSRSAMEHVVIHEALDGSSIKWFEQVSERDYLG